MLGAADDGRPAVILWADTFNEHFRPPTAQAAVEVLESAGFRVLVPKASLCCGRPLYDWGMLDLAKRLLRDVLEELREPIEAGTPIVGLEPSCVSVFRDELVGLFPGRADARRLSGQVFLLSEFLAKFAPGYVPPEVAGAALFQGHCHQQSILGTESEMGLLRRTGLEVRELDGGCCGMAGAFGFQRGMHHQVSVAAGERSVLPAVRAAAEDALIVADGFSCREQIEQGTGRRTWHFAEVLARARTQSG
jgi:Fe-S oxidoreductase